MTNVCTKHGIFFRIALAIRIQNCSPWRHFLSKCGPSMDLSLRPLV
jgi:hypothetical protein